MSLRKLYYFLSPKSFIYRGLSTTSSRFHVSLYSLSGDDDAAGSHPPPLRRSFMYVPGDIEGKVRKIPKIGADCYIVDMEDAVAYSNKAQARRNVERLLNGEFFELDKPDSPFELGIRVNAVSSREARELAQEDLRAALSQKHLPQLLNAPKVNSADDIRFLAKQIGQLMSSRTSPAKSVINLAVFIETPIALLNLERICEEAQQLNTSRYGSLPIQFSALVFGSDDYCAAAGIERPAASNPAAYQLTYPRQKIVSLASAFGVSAIDMVHIDVHDAAGLRASCATGRALGYHGKQVIHPGQIPVVHEEFAPRPPAVKWARQVLAAFEQHVAGGKGVFVHEGQMIDAPTVAQARNLVRIQDAIDRRASASKPKPSGSRSS